MMNTGDQPALLDRPAIYKFIILILIGAIGFYVGRREIGNDLLNQYVLLFYCTGKTVYFMKIFFDRIRQTAHKDLLHTDILPFIGYNALLIVISFGIDYLCLYEINNNSFSGITTREHLFPHLIAFFYFSVSVFSTAGLGDIIPRNTTAQILVSSQMMLSWFLTILVIANFTGIRDAFKQKTHKS